MRWLLTGLCALLSLTGCAGAGPEPVPDAAHQLPAAPSAAPAPVDTAAGVVLDASCTGPAGLRVAHPAAWSVNPGTVVPACTRFAPHPFTVRPASDVRAAAVVVSVEAVPLGDLSAPWPGERSRVAADVDGRPGVRTEVVTGPGLWPGGTVVTRWLVDLGADDGGPRTLVADTVHPPGDDAAAAAAEVAVLDAMVTALDLHPAAAGRL